MEHLALPKDPITPLPVVQLVCEEDSDGGPFLEYLNRNPNTLFSANEQEQRLITEDEVFRHYQTWLFFGLLSELLGPIYCYEDFICCDPEGKKCFITTRALPKLLKHWKREILCKTQVGDPHFAHFSRCLDEVFAMLREAHWNFSGFGDELGLQLDVIASVAEALEFVISDVDDELMKPVIGGFGPRRDWKQFSYQGRDDIREECIKTMREIGGWCPNDITKAEDRFRTFEAWHYLRHLKLSGDTTRHSQCDENCCRVINSTGNRCTPRHVESECPCSSFEVSSKFLTGIYSSGSLPCVRLSCKGKFRDSSAMRRRPDKLEVTIESLVFGDNIESPYIAISHVWSNGTGNSESNSLPVCQLWDLWLHAEAWREANFPTRTSEPIYIWIDTLCCPHEQGAGKNLALSKMKQIYSKAEFALVIDRSLTDWNAHDAEPLECLARLFFSPWMRRLWTAQEAILAGHRQQNTVVVQFNDMTWDWTSLYRRAGKSRLPGWHFAYDLGREIVWLEKGLWFGSDEQLPVANLQTIAHVLQYRSTSVASDEAIVLGNLLRFPSDLFIGLSQEAAMCNFWKGISKATFGALPDSPLLQKQIVFCPVPRLSTPGFRWAPKSFLNANLSRPDQFFAFDGKDFPARLTERGIQACYPSFRIHTSPSTQTICLFGDGESCETGANSIACLMPDGSGRLTRDLGGDESLNALGSRQLLHKNLCLLTHSAEIPLERMHTYALWVHLEEELDGVKYARILEPTRVTRALPNTLELLTAAIDCCSSVVHELTDIVGKGASIRNLDFSIVKERRDLQIRQYLLNHPSVMTAIKNDTKSDANDRKDYTFDDCIRSFTNIVHFFGHIGDIRVEVYPDDTVWCLD